jgi:hypothetical protein
VKCAGTRLFGLSVHVNEAGPPAASAVASVRMEWSRTRGERGRRAASPGSGPEPKVIVVDLRGRVHWCGRATFRSAHAEKGECGRNAKRGSAYLVETVRLRRRPSS